MLSKSCLAGKPPLGGFKPYLLPEPLRASPPAPQSNTLVCAGVAPHGSWGTLFYPRSFTVTPKPPQHSTQQPGRALLRRIIIIDHLLQHRLLLILNQPLRLAHAHGHYAKLVHPSSTMHFLVEPGISATVNLGVLLQNRAAPIAQSILLGLSVIEIFAACM